MAYWNWDPSAQDSATTVLNRGTWELAVIPTHPTTITTIKNHGNNRKYFIDITMKAERFEFVCNTIRLSSTYIIAETELLIIIRCSQYPTLYITSKALA